MNSVATTNGFQLINCLASFNDLMNGDLQVDNYVFVVLELMGMNGETGIGVSIMLESNMW